MKFNSRILLLILTIVVLTTLVACGGKVKDPTEGTITTTKAPDVTVAPITLATTTAAQGGEDTPATTTTASAATTTAPVGGDTPAATTTKAAPATTTAPVTTTKATTTTRGSYTPSFPFYPDYDDDDDNTVTTTKATTTTSAPSTPSTPTPAEEFATKKAAIIANATWGEGGYGYDKADSVTDSGKQQLSSLSSQFINQWSGLAYSETALDELQRAYNLYVVEVDNTINANLTSEAAFEKKKSEILASATWGDGGYRYDKASEVNTNGRSLLGKLAEDFHNAWAGLKYSETALSDLNAAYSKYKSDVNDIFTKYPEEVWTKPIK